ncbi:hypothetical protein DFH27DRAFT_631591 [Peziza echinospora]|nr:hypothetical protein DFH27DRAFT_631591 [Peziza echinospora]
MPPQAHAHQPVLPEQATSTITTSAETKGWADEAEDEFFNQQKNEIHEVITDNVTGMHMEESNIASKLQISEEEFMKLKEYANIVQKDSDSDSDSEMESENEGLNDSEGEWCCDTARVLARHGIYADNKFFVDDAEDVFRIKGEKLLGRGYLNSSIDHETEFMAKFPSNVQPGQANLGLGAIPRHGVYNKNAVLLVANNSIRLAVTAVRANNVVIITAVNYVSRDGGGSGSG